MASRVKPVEALRDTNQHIHVSSALMSTLASGGGSIQRPHAEALDARCVKQQEGRNPHIPIQKYVSVAEKNKEIVVYMQTTTM